jgi:hypothetical protein
LSAKRGWTLLSEDSVRNPECEAAQADAQGKKRSKQTKTTTNYSANRSHNTAATGISSSTSYYENNMGRSRYDPIDGRDQYL